MLSNLETNNCSFSISLMSIQSLIIWLRANDLLMKSVDAGFRMRLFDLMTTAVLSVKYVSSGTNSVTLVSPLKLMPDFWERLTNWPACRRAVVFSNDSKFSFSHGAYKTVEARADPSQHRYETEDFILLPSSLTLKIWFYFYFKPY